MKATFSAGGLHRVERFVDRYLSTALDDRTALRHLRGFVERRGLEDAVARAAFADGALGDRAVLLDFVDGAREWIAAVDHRGSQLGEPCLPLLQHASLRRGRLGHSPTVIN